MVCSSKEKKLEHKYGRLVAEIQQIKLQENSSLGITQS